MNPQRTAVLLTLLSLWSPALAGDLTGQASIVDGDTLEIHGTRIRLWGIDAPESTQLFRGDDSLRYRCGAQAANDLDAFIARRPVNCMPTTWTSTAERWRHARQEAPISENGSSTTGLHWTGRNSPRADTKPLNATRSAPAVGSGRAAMLNRGSTGPVFARMEVQPIARTMPAHIHKDAHV